MKLIFFVFLLVGGAQLACQGQNRVDVDLSIRPEARAFSCRYTLTALGVGAQDSLVLHINRQFRVDSVTGPRIRSYSSALFRGERGDTLCRLVVRLARRQARQTVTVQYSGRIAKEFSTDSIAEFSPWAYWLPNLPRQEYELVKYRLTVHAPESYQVVSTHAPHTAAAGASTFTGTAPNIEITAMAARTFAQLAAAPGQPNVAIYKANRALTARDTLLLANTVKIIDFQNRIIGRKDPIRDFRILLPGTNRNAGALRDNAIIITYSDFDTRDPEDLLTLAHEVSHKWWGYGTWDDYNNWLNEGFATYSALLYMQSIGDTATFRKTVAKHRTAAATAPPVMNPDVQRLDYPTYRKVIYSKSAMILLDLHQRMGNEQFFRLLTETAAAKVTTTPALLELVERRHDRATREWLEARLRQ